MRQIAIALLFGVLCSSAAMAETLLQLRSNADAKIFLDGQYMGRTPLNVADVGPGNHDVKLVDPATDSAQRFSFWSPRASAIRKRIDANFAPREVAVRRVYDEERFSRGRELYRNDEGRRYWVDSDGDRHYVDRNDKARVRNVGIGTTAVGLLTGSSFLTGAGLGGIIANESR